MIANGPLPTPVLAALTCALVAGCAAEMLHHSPVPSADLPEFRAICPHIEAELVAADVAVVKQDCNAGLAVNPTDFDPTSLVRIGPGQGYNATKVRSELQLAPADLDKRAALHGKLDVAVKRAVERHGAGHPPITPKQFRREQLPQVRLQMIRKELLPRTIAVGLVTQAAGIDGDTQELATSMRTVLKAADKGPAMFVTAAGEAEAKLRELWQCAEEKDCLIAVTAALGAEGLLLTDVSIDGQEIRINMSLMHATDMLTVVRSSAALNGRSDLVNELVTVMAELIVENATR